ELEPQVARLARRARRGLPRRPVRAALEARVAVAAATALRDLQAFPGLRQVAEKLARIDVVHERPARHRYLQVVSRAAGAVTACPGLAARRAVAPVDAEIGERIDAGSGDEVNAAAVSAVSAVRATALHVLFAAEAQGPGPAVPGLYAESGFVNEIHVLTRSAAARLPCTATGAGHDKRRSHARRHPRSCGTAPPGR